MSKGAWWILAAAGVLVVLVRQRQTALAGTPLFPMLPINEWIPAPGVRAAEVSAAAGSGPSNVQSEGRGQVTPTTMTAATLPFRGSPVAYSQPTAGESSAPAAPGIPGGISPSPFFPVSPGQPTPQSAVESTSPALATLDPSRAPFAANAWYSGLSVQGPFVGLFPGSGGIVDVRAVDVSKISGLE